MPEVTRRGIERTAFSDNKTDFTFVDGMLTDYVQDADSDLIGLLKLPADVIQAYFSAVGAMFTKKKDLSETEKDYLSAIQSLELQKLKTEGCLAAIQAGAEEQARIQACAP